MSVYGGRSTRSRGRSRGSRGDLFAVLLAIGLLVSGLSAFMTHASPDSISISVEDSPFDIGDPFKPRGLGDVLRVTVGVDASQDATISISLGEGLAYLGNGEDDDDDGSIDEGVADGVDGDLGFLQIDGSPVTDVTDMSLAENSLSLPVPSSTSSVSFEIQIVMTLSPLQGSWSFSGGDQVLRTIDATLVASDGTVLAMEEIAFSTQGFNGFGKHIWFVDENGDEHLVGIDPDDGQPYPLMTFLKWRVLIAVNNYFSYPWKDAFVQDRFGAEFGVQCDDAVRNHPVTFDIDESDCPIAPFGFVDVSGWAGSVSLETRGSSDQVELTWNGIDAPAYTGNWPDTWAAIDFLMFTDLNPAGRQGFTSQGCTDLNSGSVLKFVDPYTGYLLSAETQSLQVCASK